MKFKIFMLLPFFIIGIIIFNIFDPRKGIFLGLLLGCLIIFGFISIIKRNIIWIIVYIFFLVGGISLTINKENINKKYEFLIESREFEGKIIDKKEESLTIKNNKYGYKIIFFIPDKLKGKYDFNLGDYVYIKGNLKEKLSFRESNMASRGVSAYGNINKILSLDKGFKFSSIPLKVKEKVNTGLTKVSRESGPFVSGLITGYCSNMEDDDLNIFSDLDLIHIIAVSGFNVSIIYTVMMIVAKSLDIKKRLILSFLGCSLYVSITGFDPSITRAFIMISMVILGRLIGKRYTTINALSSACFLMLAINPFYIYNLGFIFSYLATLSIAIFNSDIIVKIEGYTKLFKDELGVTVSSTILTFPVALYTKGYFSIISLLVNALIGPVVSLITVLGFVSSFIYVIFPFDIILYPVAFIGDILIYLIKAFNRINPIVYTGQPTAIFIFCYYMGIVLISNIIKFKKEFYKYFSLAVLLSIVILQGPLTANNLKIHFINVGQGDSMFIETPGRKGILIDTGNKFNDHIVAESKVVPYIKKLGYNKIDYLIISHFDSDHCGGVEYIESVMPVYNKITYKGSEHKEYIGLMKGDSLNISGVKFDVLSPESEKKSEDENKNSLILRLNYKDFKALFAGDATKDEMDKISGEYEVLKVPHHGSKYSVSEKMLQNTKIESAVILVGNNNFGHPSKEVLDSFRDNSIKHYRTDKDGNILYIVNKRGYKVKFNN